jgi:hypothetical protein
VRSRDTGLTDIAVFPGKELVQQPATRMELVAPAGSLPALKAAVDRGADCVYLGFRDATNARNFAGLNFDDKVIADGIRYAHGKGSKVLLALNTYPRLSFDFLWNGGRFVVGSNQGEPHLTISASAHDFLLLARRQEDPDTLFFSRRLAMEGDTELGLLMMNTLDAIELPVFELGSQIRCSKVSIQARAGGRR